MNVDGYIGHSVSYAVGPKPLDRAIGRVVGVMVSRPAISDEPLANIVLTVETLDRSRTFTIRAIDAKLITEPS